MVIAAVLAPVPATAADDTSAVVDAQQLVYEINEARWDPDAFRTSAGATRMPTDIPQSPPLAIDGSLTASATAKADEIADYDYFAHQSAVTGMWPNALARSHGYTLPVAWSDDANNIESLHGGASDPVRVLRSFAESSSHRRHIFGQGWFADHNQIGVGRSSTENYWAVHTARVDGGDTFVTGVVFVDDDRDGRMDRGEGLGGVTVTLGGTATITNAGGGYALQADNGDHIVTAFGGALEGLATARIRVGASNVGVDFVSGGEPIIKQTVAAPQPTSESSAVCPNCDVVTLVDPGGRWHQRDAAAPTAPANAFYFGNRGDVPFTGDWDGDGEATPGLYRQSDGFVYIRFTNTQGIADSSFFFGNPGDVPLAGDFDGNGADSVSLYRPKENRVYIINTLGRNGAGLGAAEYSYELGRRGDIPFVGDFDGDGIDSIGMYRPSTGMVYLHNANPAVTADVTMRAGTQWSSVIAGDWDGDGVDTIALYRRATGRLQFLDGNRTGATVSLSFDVGDFGWAVASGRE